MSDSRRPDGVQHARHGIALIVTIGAVSVGLACTSGSGSGPDDWSRDYVSTFERVYEAAIEALKSTDFYLETEDRERGRIRARSSARRSDLEATLLVNIQQKGDRIRVDVMAQSPGLEEGRAPVQVSGIVGDFFRHLDARLEGRTD